MNKQIQKFLVRFSTFLLVILALSQIALSSDVTQLQDGDVSQNDIEFQALQSVLERYEINVALPDRTFRGKQPITRGDFVIYLNDSLLQIERLYAASTADFTDPAILINDLELVSSQLNPSNQAIETRIEQIKTRLLNLETRVLNSKALEKSQKYTHNQISPEVNSVEHNYQYISQRLPPPPRSAVKDISPNDSYYEPLKNVLEKYRINVVFPSLTFQGKEPLNRGDFAIYFSRALAYIEKIQDAASAPSRTIQERLNQIQNKFSTNQKEMESIKNRLNTLEKKIVGG